MESEPVIVVDQENCFNEEDEDIDDVAGNGQGCPDTPPQDPFFLSPFRDMRKRSLPTPQCTSGITASQVRRLSDQGAAGAAAREQAFLATLTKAPGPYTPGRRHSVITISKAPMPLFGRNRRESIAAFPSKGPRVNRRDSAGGATPSPTGSQFNLQLDIMDDIADIKAARKVRMKMWQTEDKEKMCELQSMDGENKQMSRFKEARRYSNIDVCEKIAPPIPARRRASELPPNLTPQAGKPSSSSTAAAQSSGIVCTNTDLLSIMNSLKSTATKALQSTTKGGGPRQRGSSKTTDSLPTGMVGDVSGGDRRRDVLRTGRSNSVDVANIGAAAAMAAAAAGNSTRNWFRKMSTRTATAVSMAAGQRGADAECAEQRLATAGGGEYVVQKSPVVVTFADERPKVSLLIDPSPGCKPEKHCTTPLSPPPPPPPPPSSFADKKPAPNGGDVVVWDRPTGSVVNAEVLGTAIEGFLAAKKSGDSADASPTTDGEHHEHPSQQQQTPGGKPVAKTSADPSTPARTCDTSICSSLKDLFVK
ncbi:uncharacterized protein LOC100161017 [Acyrthosiphon pisum]|uniref:Uncharacterized protein n=1 Tax=Acyrthosiphon pisum TaxID=7029 RepID=A0A8R2NS92_ACYPI|nr:uncharacterized protein LOC100161017 [Acyrthosiphon pisum]XP_029346361.1 uncharacterized protein LOC100161017 [Acyrthosiphon pisum]|eukprot:XP_001945050.2 PREDICTED: uncharacterized protein LOC100161017 [Acyrthosiphon pisum]